MFDQHEYTETFFLKDTSFFVLNVQNIDSSTVVVRRSDGTAVDSSNYILDVSNGRIRAKNIGDFANTDKLTISYKYYPIYQSKYIGYNEEGNPFDGMKIYFHNDLYGKIDAQSGWKPGSKTTWEAIINPPTTLNKTDLASDIEIRFADSIVDTSATGIGGAKIPVNFTVWDITNNAKMVFRFKDSDNDKKVSSGDDIEPMVQLPVEGGFLKNLTVWSVRLKIDSSANPIAPGDGDVIQIKTKKPFREGDVFMIKTVPQKIDEQIAQTSMDEIYVVPNPYVATTAIEASNNFRLGRGERRIEFVHLPPECTISIYTISGYLVQTIYRAAGVSDGSEFWDLRTKDRLNAAYGYYIYIVDAPGIGKKTGKFALIK